ncbi:MAG TPA: radical SAM protein, partial [Gemmatimonadales bacterium]|nr:radical SAM protein [Gemmatimonadales bacterium]
MPHVYLHVPFCQRRCSYCDFSIAVRRRVPADDYVAAVRRELALGAGTGAEPGEHRALDTLYFGGGTPSLLPPDAVAALVAAVDETFDANRARDADREVTLEANPEDVTFERATA